MALLIISSCKNFTLEELAEMRKVLAWSTDSTLTLD